MKSSIFFTGCHTAEPNDIFHSENNKAGKKRSSSGDLVDEGGESYGSAAAAAVAVAAAAAAKRPKTFTEEVKERQTRRQQQRVYPQPWAAAPRESQTVRSSLDQIGSGNGGAQQEDEWRNIHVVRRISAKFVKESNDRKLFSDVELHFGHGG